MEGVSVGVEDLKALSSRTRLRILGLLSSRNHNVTELASLLALSKSTVHEHLARLVAAGFIERDEQVSSKWAYYRLTRRGRKLLDASRQRVVLFFSAAFSFALALGLVFVLAPLASQGEAPFALSAEKAAAPAEEAVAIAPAPAGQPPSVAPARQGAAGGAGEEDTAPAAPPAVHPSAAPWAWWAGAFFFLLAAALAVAAWRRGRAVSRALESGERSGAGGDAGAARARRGLQER